MRRRKKKTADKLHMPWRENLECLSAAIVMALVLKFFIVEAYKIPTGSMQPTLMGDDGSSIYDRILVDKLTYVFRDPRRWEIVVFKYPLDLSKNYVKRLVGLPGERLAVVDGNLWVTTEATASERSPAGWRILRKPLEVQEDLWKRVYVWEDPRGAPEQVYGKLKPKVSKGSWQRSSEGMRTAPGEPFRFLYPAPDDGSIRDIYTHGYSPKLASKVQTPRVPTGQNTVGDLRLELDLTPDSQVEEFELIIRAYRREHRFRLGGPAGEDRSGIVWNRRFGTAQSKDNPTAESDFRLAAGESYEIAAEACDQRLRLVVDGEEIARVEYDSSWCKKDPSPLSAGSGGEIQSRVEFGLSKGSVQVTRIAVQRDIHYHPRLPPMNANQPDWALKFTPLREELAPEDCYFMMGDNTQNSLDSRGWQEVAMPSEVSGETIVGNLNPQPDNPDRNPHPRKAEAHREILRSTAGFEHLVEGSEEVQYAPYVKREYIVGKALLVFWPVQPVSIESRWKFIR